MIEFLMMWYWIGQGAHSRYKNIDNQGGLPYKPGGFLEVSSP